MFSSEPDDASKGQIELLWGIKADTSSTLLAYVNPYFKYSDYIVNRDFDMREPESQQFMEDWCVALHQSPLVHTIKPKKCVISEFRTYVERKRFVRFPVEVDQFDNLFADFLEDTEYASMKTVWWASTRGTTQLMFMGVSVRADFKKTTGAWELLEIWNDWQVLLKRYNQVAPPTVGKAIMVSDLFVSMATQVEAIMSRSTIWVACVLVVLVVVACRILPMACLFSSTCCSSSASSSPACRTWRWVGGVEAIALTVLGMSCDYCLHLRHHPHRQVKCGRSRRPPSPIRPHHRQRGNFSTRVRAHRGFLRPHPEQFRAHHCCPSARACSSASSSSAPCASSSGPDTPDARGPRR